jgi:3-oxoacyl-[acyl-carrier protein] reductase
MILAGKLALITGASRGIGKATAITFAAQGATVLLVARSESILELATELNAQGQKATAFIGDITNEETVKELIKTCRNLGQPLDIVVNNAGILEQGLIGMIPPDSINRLLNTNVTALINLTQYAVRLMGKSTSPSIINIASIAGTQGIEGVSAYAASKAAVVGFTLAAAKELAAKKIRVNAIAPGFIDTDMTQSMPPDWYQKRLDSVRLGRIGTAQDIANCALFLASDLSSYITGQTIGVDGGMAA